MKKYLPYIIFFIVFFLLFKLINKIPQIHTTISNITILIIDALIVGIMYLKDKLIKRHKN
jgi:hypothetical protein